MALSGSAGYVTGACTGGASVCASTFWTDAACEVAARDVPAGPSTYWITTGLWCWPHQSPTNTAPAPDATAKTHAPMMDAADARVFHVLIRCLPLLGWPCPRSSRDENWPRPSPR